jgi:ATP-binding cassette subfamily B multidrug efflux pump
MKSWARLVELWKPYRAASVAALILLSLVVAMDLAIPRMIQRIIDDGVNQGDLGVVLVTGLWMIGATILSALLSIGNTILSVRVGEGFARDLRDALFSQIQQLSFGNLDRLRTGRLIVRLTSDVTQVQQVVQILIRIGTRAPLLMVGSLILMFITSPRLAAIMTPLIVITVALLVFFLSKMRALFLAVQRRLDRLNNVLQENLAGVRVVKAFVRRTFEERRFGVANVDLTDASIRVTQMFAYLFPSLMLLINMGTVVVVWFGGLEVIADGMTIGEIMAFINYLLTTIAPLGMMAMVTAHLASAQVSAVRINEVLEDEPEIVDRPKARILQDAVGRVTFDGAFFSYDGGCSEPVLHDIHLNVEPGETVAILGGTGSWKSSLVNLIPRFYDVTDGRVLLDGVDVRKVTHESLQSHIGVALQETVLFSGTVRENICYGRPEASDEEVIAAAKIAQAHDFIMAFPDGYDSAVEARGRNLSGGQKQRIAIARALLIDPRILILDDSTSAVDVETEGAIQDGLERFAADRTTFIIAQRVSSVLNADKIVVLERGRIVGVGDHEALIASNPIYQEIYDSQLGDGGVRDV